MPARPLAISHVVLGASVATGDFLHHQKWLEPALQKTLSLTSPQMSLRCCCYTGYPSWPFFRRVSRMP